MRDERDDATESRRILQRLSQQSDGAAMSNAVRRSLDHARDHMAASDIDETDWVELWGTRIGRSIGLVLLVGLLIWLGLKFF